MPEEINRVVADHLSRWLFAPTPTAVANLAAEGIVDGVVQVGDVMQDLAARIVGRARSGRPRAPCDRAADAPSRALHFRHDPSGREPRAGRDRRRGPACSAPSRPRTGRSSSRSIPARAAALDAPGSRLSPDVRVIEPQGYRTTLALQLHAAAVVTDSGGVQREAAWLGVPCLVLRATTEWVEAVAGSGGAMVVCGAGRGPGAT